MGKLKKIKKERKKNIIIINNIQNKFQNKIKTKIQSKIQTQTKQ
jgi:hypothetical protein